MPVLQSFPGVPSGSLNGDKAVGRERRPYYICHCFLDVSKAFDKVNHYGLYLKLIKRGIPLMLLNVIINWYGKCTAVVRWESSCSRCFPVTCGVRQGGVLSPFLFAIYVDDVIINLHNKRLGCTVGGSYIWCLMYADDLVLLSASLTVLQQMVDVCE